VENLALLCPGVIRGLKNLLNGEVKDQHTEQFQTMKRGAKVVNEQVYYVYENSGGYKI